MSHRPGILLPVRVFWELLRYDVVFACRGLKGVRSWRTRQTAVPAVDNPESETAICEAVRAVAPFYWKPIRCLQRAIVTARLMQGRGIMADVVVGYRLAPFLGHAWVEVAGRVANDSQIYQARLQVLERF